MSRYGAEGSRTLDLCIANAALSQLSYRPELFSRDVVNSPYSQSVACSNVVGVSLALQTAIVKTGSAAVSGRSLWRR